MKTVSSLNAGEPVPGLAQAAAEEREARRKSSCRVHFSLWIFLVLTATAYVALHILIPPRETLWKPCQLVETSPAGRILNISEVDLRWYLGREQTAVLVSGLMERSRRIEQLEDKVVRQALLEFEVRFGSPGTSRQSVQDRIGTLSTAARAGDFDSASKRLTDVVRGWTDETRRTVGEKSIFELTYGLGELARLQKQQREALGRALQPPLAHQIFWMSPRGALAEALFWSTFGTITNLLLIISDARRRGNYRRSEIWVSVSKIIYGPILSTVLILAIYFGLLDASTEVRFWFLPMAGFLFGYNTRKTARVIDQLSEKLLGRASESVRQEEELRAKAAGNALAALQASARPANLSELKQQATAVADAATVTAILNQQGRS